jgi:regulatory protein
VRVRRRPARAGLERVARPPLDAVRARAVALDLLSRKAWTRRQLTDRLRRRGAPAGVAEAVVADFEARGYVDDRAFATAWAEVRARGRAYGPRRLREALLAKGVARELVDAAVRRAFAEVDEETRARAAAARRLPQLRRVAPDQAVRRLSAYLLRRGFPGEIVRRVVRDACRVEILEE